MSMWRTKLLARFPDLQSIVPVFAVVSTFSYGWTFFSIFWVIRSWLKNLVLSEILALFAYSMVFNLLEALAIVVILVICSVVLPGRFLKERFVVRGTLLALCILGSILLHLKLFESDVELGIVRSPGYWWLASSILTVILVIFLPRIRTVESIVYGLADRSLVFLYLFIPLSMLGLSVILIRLVLGA